LGKLEKELAELAQKSGLMKTQWDAEKAGLARIRDAKEKLEEVRREEQKAERGGDLGKAAELRYGKCPLWKKK
jgi:ATP-dependent Clp protease ATP-binding subunit ClpB